MHYHCEIYAPEHPVNVFRYVEHVMLPYHYSASELYSASNLPLDADSSADGVIFPGSCDTRRPTPFCDYWVVGGRWSGEHSLSLLDREKLAQFWETVRKAGLIYFDQTDEMAFLFRMFFPDYSYTPPMIRSPWNYTLYEDDIFDLKLLPDSFDCYTLIVPGHGVFHTEEFDEESNIFVPTSFDGYVKPFLRGLGITDGYLITVDYHS